MANKKTCFHLGILFMLATLAVGSRILVSDSEGFPTTAGSKLRRLSEAQNNSSTKPSESNDKSGNLGLGESQKKKDEGTGLAKKGGLENDKEVFTPPRIDNKTVGVNEKDGHKSFPPPGSFTKSPKPDKVKHGGSQRSNVSNTGNGAPLKKEPKTPKNDNLGTKKNESGSQTKHNLAPPQQNLVPPVPSKQNLTPPQQDPVPPVDTKGSTDQTHNNGRATNPPAKKENQSPPEEGHKDNSTGTAADADKEKSGAKSNKDANSDSRNEPVCDEAHSCTDEKKIVVACLRALGNDMQELSLLIQNKGANTLHVNIDAPAFLKIDPLNSTVEKQKNKSVKVSMVNIVPQNVSLSKIVINVGDGECILDVPNQYVNHLDKQRFFYGFSYSTIVTPMFGVYLLLFTVLAIGGSWICCKLRGKRRHGDGIRYQELEMNHPESNLSTNGGKLEAESMDGWDEWDDTWEDAEAGRSSTRPIQTVSSNGLASRRSNKDGWDNSWDD